MTNETVDANGPKDGPTADSWLHTVELELNSYDAKGGTLFVVDSFAEPKKLGHPSAARLAKRKR